MKKNFINLLCFIFFIATATSNAMEGTFDRSTEIDKYINIIQSGTKGDIISATQSICWSGLSDKRLAAAINQRLMDDFMEIRSQRIRGIDPRFDWTTDERYGVSLINALASMGLPEYISTFEKIDSTANKDRRINKRVHHAARFAPKILGSRTGMGELMLSRANHIEGGDPMTSMLINLLHSDKRSFRDFALDKIYRENMRDPRLMDALADQVNDYISRSPVSEIGWKEAFVRRNIAYLGLSGYHKYRDTLQGVLNSQADEEAKDYARIALERLQ